MDAKSKYNQNMKLKDAYHSLTKDDIMKMSEQEMRDALLALVELEYDDACYIYGAVLTADNVADALRRLHQNP